MHRIAGALVLPLAACAPESSTLAGGQESQALVVEPTRAPGWEFNPAFRIREGLVEGVPLSASSAGALTAGGIPGTPIAAAIWVEANQAWEFFLYQTPATPPATPGY